MIRIGKAPLASALGALLALGVCGATSAQAGMPQDPAVHATQPKQQDKLEKDKAALKDRVNSAIGQADANIDALGKMAFKDSGKKKDRDEAMQKKLTGLRDKLKDDMGKIETAAAADWKNVLPIVQRDLYAARMETRRVAAVTKVPMPRQGATNKQPPAKKQKK